MLRNKIHQSFGSTNLTHLVWRGAIRHPSVIFETGFVPKDTTNESVLAHIKIKNSGGYVAARRDFESALHFIPENAFMYTMNLPEIFVDAHVMYALAGKEEPHCANIGTFENELAACYLRASDIYQAKQWSHIEPGEGRFFAGPLYKNEGYKPRNWAFEILSRSSEEAKQYEDKLRQAGMLSSDQRVMTFGEAQIAVEVFTNKFKNVPVPFNAPVTVIKTIPVDLKNEDEVVNYAVALHQERLKAQRLAFASTAISLFSSNKSNMQVETECQVELPKVCQV